MNNFFKKSWLIIIFTLFISGMFLSLAQPAYAGTLTASITTAAACTGGNKVILLRLSGTGNAHAELPAQANYTGNVVCGDGVVGLGNSCSGTFATILKLSGLSNAHSEQNSQSNYANSACISVSSGSVSVGYQATNCSGFDATLASMSGVTNAHVGNSAAYSAIQICATAAAIPPPTITTYTNSTESGLNYAGSCSGCGARIGGGAGFRQTVVITGTDLGADPGVGNRSSATYNVKVGAQQIADTNVTAWSATSITFRTDSAISGDADSDWGADFGGAAALTVTAGGSTTAGLNFYVFPQITSVTQPGGFAADTAREYYDAGDTDGIITLNGTRFGTALGSGSVTIVSQTGTTTAWGNTAITVRVPAAIVDTVNTGSIAMTQGTGTNGKTHTYLNTLRVLPRITGFTPASDSESSAITVNGNHFCQTGTCPVAFSAADKVTFTSALDATVFTSWSATAIATVIPVGAVTGNVVVTSNTSYTSNGTSLTVLSNIPSSPNNLDQWDDSGFTEAIVIGGVSSSPPVYLPMAIQVSGVSGGTLYPQVEYKAIGTPFVCTGTAVCASDALEGTGAAGPGPVVGWKAISPTDNVYHWQARAKHTKNSVDYYSPWVSFDSGNPETATDFQIDTTAPAITSISSGSPGTNGATITWSTLGEISTSQVQYNTTGTFVADCATYNDCTTITDTSPMVNNHSVALSNLNSGTTYYYRVRSKDAVDNEALSSNNTFATSSVTQPGKTTEAYISGATGVITGATTYYFTVDAPETAIDVKSAYVEVTGVALDTGSVAIAVNSVSSRSYTISAASATMYRLLYEITSPDTETNLNLEDVAPCSNSVAPPTGPLCNKIVITPSTTDFYILSAKIIITYAYTP